MTEINWNNRNWFTFKRSFPDRLLCSSSVILLLLVAFGCDVSPFDVDALPCSPFAASSAFLSALTLSLDGFSSQQSSSQQLSHEHSLQSDMFSSPSSSSPLWFLFWVRNSSGSMPLILSRFSNLSYSSRKVLKQQWKVSTTFHLVQSSSHHISRRNCSRSRFKVLISDWPINVISKHFPFASCFHKQWTRSHLFRRQHLC